MNLGEFFLKYPDEASCVEAFKSKRLVMGLAFAKMRLQGSLFPKN